jgi:alkanesulfonate monooxygenase SsuD/methylene tetrahydromethanopterin reductase-like flavin-dependent oxidoreductase (luciferase family)
MNIGIGLPSTIPGVDRESLLESARRAEAAGFSSLGTIDRLVYPNYEPLTSLAAASAVTERIKLATAIVLAPLRANAALLAKQAATLDNISGGRLVLGLAPGSRQDDFEAAGIHFHTRGKQFDSLLEEMESVWKGEEKGFAGPVGPAPVNGERPAVLIGGTVDVSFERAARYADGWIAGGSGPDGFAEGASKTREAWQRAGREGSPQLWALQYFSLGPDAEKNARDYLGHYYAILGDEIAGMIVENAVKTDDEVKEIVAAFEERGCDELILFPCSKDPEQVDLLAGALDRVPSPATG